MNQIDHLLWATADLDQGISKMHDLTGGQVHTGGSHPGAGTRNALLGLDNKQYLEVIAPDPAQVLKGNWGEQLSALAEPKLFTFAVTCHDFDDMRERLAAIGITIGEPNVMTRPLPNGEILKWRLAMPRGHNFGPVIPFLIDWGDAPHPSASLAATCSLTVFGLSHPDPDAVNKVLAAMQLDITCTAGEAGLHACFATPNGAVDLN